MLIYIGNGDWLADVPARDLTKEEVEQYGKKRLLDSGLYKEPVAKEAQSKNKKEAGD